MNEQVGKENGASKRGLMTSSATYGTIFNEDSRQISLVMGIRDKQFLQSLSNPKGICSLCLPYLLTPPYPGCLKFCIRLEYSCVSLEVTSYPGIEK